MPITACLLQWCCWCYSPRSSTYSGYQQMQHSGQLRTTAGQITPGHITWAHRDQRQRIRIEWHWLGASVWCRANETGNVWGGIQARRSVDGLVAFPPEAEEKYEDVYSPHRQKTQKNTTQYTRKRLQYDETIQYNILQYSRVCIIKKNNYNTFTS